MKASENLFLDSLVDMYYGENQLVKALPKLAKAAMSYMATRKSEAFAWNK
jgi:ferritin-like metal-binding protein YciE